MPVLPRKHETMIDIGVTPFGSLYVRNEAVREHNARGVGADADDTVLTTGCLWFAELELSVLAFAELAFDSSSIDLHELLPTTIVFLCRSTSSQRSPQVSPRRRPVIGIAS